MMRYHCILLSALALGSTVVTSCNSTVPPVPPSNRTVVGPAGSVDGEKPWNTITQREGDAVLGPLSNARR